MYSALFIVFALFLLHLIFILVCVCGEGGEQSVSPVYFRGYQFQLASHLLCPLPSNYCTSHVWSVR